MKTLSAIGLLGASALLAACGTHSIQPGTACATDRFVVDDAFEGARRGPCRVTGDSEIVLEILPEDANVTNESPWYAFRVTPTVPGDATVTLDYGTWKHRYEPKIREGNSGWVRLDTTRVETSEDGRTATLLLPLGDVPVWVAAQPLIVEADYEAFNAALVATSDAEFAEPGYSRGGRPIPILRSAGEHEEVVMLIGRQHPPEVSGVFAFMSFVETLFADTPLAAEFRKRYSIVAIPLLNPDGVAAGHWRHGLGGVDINRDWGTFSQPETVLVLDLLTQLDEEDRQLKYFIDFHSTRRNLFYTFPDEFVWPENFFHEWFSRASEKLVDYPFTNENGLPKTNGVGKNYINERYEIAAATYEVGDETDRDIAEAAAVVFANEFMAFLLEQPR